MSKKEPDLSIVMVSFNTLNLTKQCLQSIYRNTANITFETWVIDNNSFDGSAEVIELEFPQVHLIRNNRNKGVAAATNQGLEKSRGRYVLTLNSDTVILPATFEKLVRFMDEHPDAGAATPNLIRPDNSPHPNVIGKLPTLKSELLDVLSRTRWHKKIDVLVLTARYGEWTDYSRTREVPFILWGTCLIVRREVLKTVGFQDTRFYVYFEDWDWLMRIVKRGWKLYYVAEVEVVHYGGQSTKQISTKMLAQYWRSRCRGMVKHNGILAGLLLRAVIATLYGVKIVRLIVLSLMRPAERPAALVYIRQMEAIISGVLS
jgi:GT2 family glycosyltransferase